MLYGTCEPITNLIEAERGANGSMERVLATIPTLLAFLPASGIAGLITQDPNTAFCVGVSCVWAKGFFNSLILEFWCPPDERSFREKLGPFGKIPHLRGSSRLHLPR